MESLSMVSHTNALIKNRETIDINLYEQFIKYLDASPKTVETYKKSLKQMFSYLLSNNVTSPRCEDLLAYRNYLFAKGLKPTTIQNYITAAKIETAVKSSLLYSVKKNPAKNHGINVFLPR